MRTAALILLASALAVAARNSKSEQPWQVVDLPFGPGLHAKYGVEPVDGGCALHHGTRLCDPFDGGACEDDEILNPPHTLQCGAARAGLTCDCPSDGGVHVARLVPEVRGPTITRDDGGLVEVRSDGGTDYLIVRSNARGCDVALSATEKCVVDDDPVFGRVDCEFDDYLRTFDEMKCGETQGLVQCECPTDGGRHTLGPAP